MNNYEKSLLIDNMIPIKQELKVRKEDENHIYLVNWKEGKLFLASKTFFEILNICGGDKTVNEIIEVWAKEYPNVDYNIISNDVKYVINKSLEYGFIKMI